jgi:uncharacterized protein YfiM (DUF2279 family)
MKLPALTFLFLLSPLLASSAFSQSGPITSSAAPGSSPDAGWWCSLPKEKKVLYTNIAAASFITLYGFADWDYGSAQFHWANEGWFEKDAKYGGADKMGHFWSTYALSDALTGLYKHWGYDGQRANTYAALSSWTVQTIMELDDATSETQGFDWGDMTMNTVGMLASVLMEHYPALDRKIDFRVEYAFNAPIKGLFDDYSNMYYAMVVKLDGFDSLQDTWLDWLELHGGYCTRGYDTPELDKERDFYFGVSINFSRLLRQHGQPKAAKVLEYLQVPYTVPKLSAKLG